MIRDGGYGLSLTIDVTDSGDGSYTIPDSIASCGEKTCRELVNARLRELGVRRNVGYKTFWRWRKFIRWEQPPYEKRQIEWFARFGRYVSKGTQGGVGLDRFKARDLALEEVFGED